MIVTLNKVVLNSLMDHGYGEEMYEKFLHWSIRGYKEFHIDMGKKICTVSCEMNSYKAIKLPDDFIALVSIGVACSDGIRTFAHDSNIPLNPQTRVDEEACPTTTTPVEQIPFTGVNYYTSFYTDKFGSDLGRLFGLTVKSNGTGYWRYNKDQNEIQLNPILWPNRKIYLEYIGSAVIVGKETVIDPLAEQLISLYLDWMRLEYNDKASANQRMWKKQLYDQEFDRTAGRMAEWDVQDLKEYTNNHFHQTVRV